MKRKYIADNLSIKQKAMECALFNGLKFDDSAYFYVGGQVMRVTTQMINSYQRDSIGIKV